MRTGSKQNHRPTNHARRRNNRHTDPHHQAVAEAALDACRPDGRPNRRNRQDGAQAESHPESVVEVLHWLLGWIQRTDRAADFERFHPFGMGELPAYAKMMEHNPQQQA